MVDEHGAPIPNVEITLCYLGWGWDWDMSGGFPLVMGKSYCADPVITDQRGNYKVYFSGPPSTFILARHKDWVQRKSFLAKENLVVLISKYIYDNRLAEQEANREKAFRQRKPNESGVEYYCRVISKRSSKIDIDYHGHRINLDKTLFVGSGKAIIAVTGPYNVVQSLADDLVIREKGLEAKLHFVDSFVALPQTTRCRGKMYYIETMNYITPTTKPNKDGSVKVEIPSLHAVFTMQIWIQEEDS